MGSIEGWVDESMRLGRLWCAEAARREVVGLQLLLGCQRLGNPAAHTPESDDDRDDERAKPVDEADACMTATTCDV